VLDNEAYGETGGQMSHTVGGQPVGVAQACGIADTSTLETMAEIEAFAVLPAGRFRRAALRQRQDRRRESGGACSQPRMHVRAESAARVVGFSPTDGLPVSASCFGAFCGAQTGCGAAEYLTFVL